LGQPVRQASALVREGCTCHIAKKGKEKMSLPSNRQHLSNDDCLEDQREDYHNCFMLYCVTTVHRDMHTHVTLLIDEYWFMFTFEGCMFLHLFLTMAVCLFV